MVVLASFTPHDLEGKSCIKGERKKSCTKGERKRSRKRESLVVEHVINRFIYIINHGFDGDGE